MAKPVIIFWAVNSSSPEAMAKTKAILDERMPDFETIVANGIDAFTYIESPDKPPIHVTLPK